MLHYIGWKIEKFQKKTIQNFIKILTTWEDEKQFNSFASYIYTYICSIYFIFIQVTWLVLCDGIGV